MSRDALGVIGGNHCPTSFLESMRLAPLCLRRIGVASQRDRSDVVADSVNEKAPILAGTRSGLSGGGYPSGESLVSRASGDGANVDNRPGESIANLCEKTCQRLAPYSRNARGTVKFFCGV